MGRYNDLWVWFGHSGPWIVIDVLLAFVPIMLWKGLISGRWRKQKWRWLLVYVWLLFLPNALYLGFEFKHLLRNDGVGQPFSMGALWLFGGISLLGWVLSVWAINAAVREVFRGYWRYVAGGVLSAMCVWGVVLGDMRLHSAQGLLDPRLIVGMSLRLLANGNVLLFFGVSSVILSGWVWWSLYLMDTVKSKK